MAGHVVGRKIAWALPQEKKKQQFGKTDVNLITLAADEAGGFGVFSLTSLVFFPRHGAEMERPLTFPTSPDQFLAC